MKPHSIHGDLNLTPVPSAARELIDGLSNCDIDQAASGLSENVRLSVRSEECAMGKAHVRNVLIRVLGCVHSIRCELAVVWIRRNVAIIEADVLCERSDGARLEFPLTLVLRFREQLIEEVRLLTYEPALAANLNSLREQTTPRKLCSH